MSRLILTIGLPRSGKTTWAKEQNCPIVNPDSIRLALHGKRFIKESELMVWAIAKYMVGALFLAGHDKVVFDATNTTEKRREVWKSFCFDINADFNFVVINTKASVCIERAMAEKDYEIIPVIKRMAKETDVDSLKEHQK